MDVIDPKPNQQKSNTAQMIERILWTVAIATMLFSLLFDTPIGIAQGVWKIILHPDGLITDYSKVGGFGATLTPVLLCQLPLSLLRKAMQLSAVPPLPVSF